MSADASPHRVVPPSRRRDKPILSCTLCRRRKLKCDRQQPCKTCVDRGLSMSCTYVRSAAPAGSSPLERKSSHNVHDRINQLESLVTTLMEAKGVDHETPMASTRSSIGRHSDDSADGEIPGTPDRVKLSSDTESYTNSSHWTSILDGIADLREELDQIPTSAQGHDESNDILGPDLLFGPQRHATKQELLAGLPPRAETDHLIVTYFASLYLAPVLIHRPTFLREYDTFWKQPYDTPIMWIGLLYSILALATQLQKVLDTALEDEQLGLFNPKETSLYSARTNFYREKTVQCLVLAHYTNCPPYTVETFVQYYITEYLRSRDSQFGIWIVVGMIVRMAFRMGYHREPSRFGNISPFKAEMRRRLWGMLMQLDLVTSSQVGLPRMIQPHEFDTEEPRNLTDEDFDENSVELPPSRPFTDATPMLYSIMRNRVLNVFAKIMDLTNTTKQPQYREIMELDMDLRNVYDNIPRAMKSALLGAFDAVHSDVAMRQLFMALLFLRAQITLHRPYLLLGRTDRKYEYSRLVCLNASLEILDYQRKLDAETRPGGKLWSPKWRLWTVNWRRSSHHNQDFLLATTILSLDLNKDLVDPLPPPEGSVSSPQAQFDQDLPTRATIIEALSNAYTIWIKDSENSHEAQKVAAAVKLVLGKANASVGENYSTPTSQNTSAIPFPTYQFNDQTNGATPSAFFDIINPGLGPTYPLCDISTEFAEAFDWETIDSRFQGPPMFEQGFQNTFLG